MNVRLSESAERDLTQAFVWYEGQREDWGYRFMARVDEAIDSISENPTLHARLIGDARRVLVDQFPYAIWYKIKGDEALVIGCLHHKRDLALAKARALNPEP